MRSHAEGFAPTYTMRRAHMLLLADDQPPAASAVAMVQTSAATVTLTCDSSFGGNGDGDSRFCLSVPIVAAVSRLKLSD